MEQRREEYRKASFEWHRFLGFEGPPLASRKRPAADLILLAGGQVKKHNGVPPSVISRLTRECESSVVDIDRERVTDTHQHERSMDVETDVVISPAVVSNGSRR